ncbi:MAG: hypothetical protein AAF847_07265, partial [Bacteroidota bacterium]
LLLRFRWTCLSTCLTFSKAPSDRNDVVFDDFWKKSSKTTPFLSKRAIPIANFYEIKISNWGAKVSTTFTTQINMSKDNWKFVFLSIKTFWASLLHDLKNTTRIYSKHCSKLPFGEFLYAAMMLIF